MSIHDKYAELLKEYNDMKLENERLMLVINELHEQANYLNSDVCYWRDAYHNASGEYWT